MILRATLAASVLSVVAGTASIVACEPGAESFGARCASDRDCNAMSYCVAGCGASEGRCIPYGNDTDVMSYRPVECCAGKDLYYTGIVSESYKARVKEAMNKAGAGAVADATKSFPPALVQAALNDQPQQCISCNGPAHAAPISERCVENSAPPPPVTDEPKDPTTTTNTTAVDADAGVAPPASTGTTAPPPTTTTPELASDAGPK